VGAPLSLSGGFARFGRQAAAGLRAWQALQPGDVELRIQDDESDVVQVARCVSELAASCDVVLGPYSSTLTRVALEAIGDSGALLWNHGGAADDVQRSGAGRMVSILTPSRRYCEPLMRHLSELTDVERLLILHGGGGFARQVATGAESLARARGMQVDSFLTVKDSQSRSTPARSDWKRLALMCVGSFEEDVRSVSVVRSWADPPAVICAVAAGVRDFEGAIEDPAGVYGIAQWLPGWASESQAGPAEDQFIETYRANTGSLPDYPAAQAAATAAIAVHCVEASGGTAATAVWEAAANTRTRTFFGEFAIDAESGEQTAHETVLTLWGRGGLAPAQ
jgi:ABC-type branched-subunit amino acid transport system substrate-binding protein